MAIVWGGYYDGARLGIEFVRTGSNGDGETWTVNAWLEKYSQTWDQTGMQRWSVSGSYSASGVLSLSRGPTLVKIWSGSKYWPRNYGAGRRVSASFSVTEVVNRWPPSVSASIAIGAKPYQPPAVPASVMAVRETDNQIVISYTAAVSGGAPVSHVIVERSTDGAGYVQVASVAGSGGKTWTDTGVSSGHYYQYRVRSHGAGGASGWAYSSQTYTTPMPPKRLEANKSGADIDLVWVNRTVGSTSIRVWEDTTLLATLPGDTTTYRIVSPAATSKHTYALSVVTASGLESVRIVSNEVVLATNPYAPSGLSPNGEYAPTGEDISLGWVFNTADTSHQTQVEIQIANDPEAKSWDTIFEGGWEKQTYMYRTPRKPIPVVWRVRTWGQDPSKPSPWSTPARFDTAIPPTVRIETPKSGQIVDSSQTTIRFTTTDRERVYWRGELYSQNQLIDQATGDFTNLSATWHIDGLVNSQKYVVVVRAGNKVWSPAVSREFPVDYAAPDIAQVHATFMAQNASVQLDITNPANAPLVVSNSVQRSVDGHTWKTIGDQIAPTSVFIDHTPPLDTALYYRVLSLSELDTQSTTPPIKVTPSGVRGVYLNWGPDGQRCVHLQWNNPRSTTINRIFAKEHVFAGHNRPTLIVGDALRQETTLSAWLGNIRTPTVIDTVHALHDAGTTNTVVVLRRRDYPPVSGYLSQVACPLNEDGTYTANITHVETS